MLSETEVMSCLSNERERDPIYLALVIQSALMRPERATGFLVASEKWISRAVEMMIVVRYIAVRLEERKQHLLHFATKTDHFGGEMLCARDSFTSNERR